MGEKKTADVNRYNLFNSIGISYTSLPTLEINGHALSSRLPRKHSHKYAHPDVTCLDATKHRQQSIQQTKNGPTEVTAASGPSIAPCASPPRRWRHRHTTTHARRAGRDTDVTWDWRDVRLTCVTWCSCGTAAMRLAQCTVAGGCHALTNGKSAALQRCPVGIVLRRIMQFFIQRNSTKLRENSRKHFNYCWPPDRCDRLIFAPTSFLLHRNIRGEFQSLNDLHGFDRGGNACLCFLGNIQNHEKKNKKDITLHNHEKCVYLFSITLAVMVKYSGEKCSKSGADFAHRYTQNIQGLAAVIQLWLYADGCNRAAAVRRRL